MSYLTPKRKALLLRFLKVAAAGVLAWALQWIASGALVDWIPSGYAPLAQTLLTALLLGAEKALRTPTP